VSLQQLLQSQRLHRHQTSRSELNELRAVIDRDLKDARIDALSADRRFAVAYNAVQQLAKILLACEGYRVSTSKGGHHATTFEAAAMILGTSHQALIDYFDTCRQKRNQVNYDHAGLTSDTEAEELVERTDVFRSSVEDWIKQHHPQFV
jgi:uncharacterized protein (UPF0332 family)